MVFDVVDGGGGEVVCVVEVGVGVGVGVVVVVEDVVVEDVVVDVDLVDDVTSKNTAAVTDVAELVGVQAPAGAVPSAHLNFPSLIPSHTSATGISSPSSW